MRSRVALAVSWAVTLALPLVILLGWLRVVWSRWFVNWEYSRLPAEQSGLSSPQRRELAGAWIDYFRFGGDPRRAAEQFRTLRDSAGQLWYTGAEVDHMIDVRILTDKLWIMLGVAAAVCIVGLALLLLRRADRPLAFRALWRGGLLSAALLLSAGLFLAAAWQTFFYKMHELLFPQGNWMFNADSTLIRLFPDQFWFEAGVAVAGGALVISLLVAAVGWLGLRMRGEARPVDCPCAGLEPRV
ncbi:MAG: DUF1461 domain-containing protein [Candidatus Nanopelagicales bacterium]